MTSLIRWLAPIILVVILVLSVTSSSSIQNIATNSTTEVITIEESIDLGQSRYLVDKSGEVEGQLLTREDVLNIMVKKLLLVQKQHPYDLVIDYVFFDSDGQVTAGESINSVQFNVQYINEKGEVKGSAEKHLEISRLMEGTEGD